MRSTGSLVESTTPAWPTKLDERPGWLLKRLCGSCTTTFRKTNAQNKNTHPWLHSCSRLCGSKSLGTVSVDVCACGGCRTAHRIENLHVAFLRRAGLLDEPPDRGKKLDAISDLFSSGALRGRVRKRGLLMSQGSFCL